MIAIINYGVGNLKSVKKALEFVGAKVKVTAKPSEIKQAKAIILPGVGAFRVAMKNLDELKIIPVLKEEIKKGKLFLGICLGLQLLFTQSHEDGLCAGLDIIKGQVKKFNFSNDLHLKIPHMGWNTIKIKNKKQDILEGIPDNSYFYFVHSYYIEVENKKQIMSVTDYGGEFCSAIGKNNVYGMQFHPEKSGDLGLKILDNFYKLSER